MEHVQKCFLLMNNLAYIAEIYPKFNICKLILFCNRADAALDQLKNDNFPVNEEDEVRLSLFTKAHFNMLGRYSFSISDEVKDGKLRSLKDPNNP